MKNTENDYVSRDIWMLLRSKYESKLDELETMLMNAHSDIASLMCVNTKLKQAQAKIEWELSNIIWCKDCGYWDEKNKGYCKLMRSSDNLRVTTSAVDGCSFGIRRDDERYRN